MRSIYTLLFSVVLAIAFAEDRSISRSSSRDSYSNSKNAPAFLKLVDQSARRNFQLIVDRDDLTKGEVKKQVAEWATNQGSEVENSLSDFENQKKLNVTEMKEKIQKLLEDIPAILKQYDEIKDNQDITKKEERQQIHKLYDSADKRTATIVRAIFDSFNTGTACPMPQRGRDGGRGRGNNSRN